MATIRVNKTKDYTVMSNTHFREKGMSLKAKGLLSLMLSLPDNWDYSINGLATLSKDGKDSVMGALKELEQFGYLIRTKCIKENGQFDGYDYDIYEQPNTEKPKEVKPYAEKPNTENQAQLSNKELNKKELTINKKERKKESTYDAIINELVFEEVKPTIYEFIKMRKLIKKPLTDFALKKVLNKLNKLSLDPQTQISILEKSIMNNWQDIYEPKAETKPVQNSSVIDDMTYFYNKYKAEEEENGVK